MISIIVAYNGRQVIGNNLGKVPWHIPEDLKYFKQTTMGHPCIMGRNTWDSIPAKYRPLPGRFNIVVTRKQDGLEFHPDWQLAYRQSVEDAIAFAKTMDEEVFITGGAQVYRYCLDHNLVDRVLASEVKNHIDVEGATFFPDLKQLGWTGTVVKDYAEFAVMEYRKHDHHSDNQGAKGAG
jgi:dihydrofolate reductase